VEVPSWEVRVRLVARGLARDSDKLANWDSYAAGLRNSHPDIPVTIFNNSGVDMRGYLDGFLASEFAGK
jgi:hypothetical protein